MTQDLEFIDYKPTLEFLHSLDMSDWQNEIAEQINTVSQGNRWGDLPSWLSVLDSLPEISPDIINLDSDVITIGSPKDINDEQRQKLKSDLMALHPWRKGPFSLFGTYIDTEWRSDLKWLRLKDHISSLKGRRVLDIGCGSGYHCLRMKGEGARLALGIDPTLLYCVQFQVFQKYISDPTVNVLPLGIDHLPMDLKVFDTVFSMGLLYHRRAPFDHLLHLKGMLRDGGELVLETIVIDGKEGEVLSPSNRYACMPNVWFIPSILTLEAWLKKCKFKDIKLVDETKTTSEEQRATEWMGFQSLKDFLDPNDDNKTLEGYPAPKRAIITAKV